MIRRSRTRDLWVLASPLASWLASPLCSEQLGTIMCCIVYMECECPAENANRCATRCHASWQARLNRARNIRFPKYSCTEQRTSMIAGKGTNGILPCVSHLLGDKTFCTGIRRCARPVRALRPPPVRCTPYASQIPRRRCSTSTGRSVSPQRLPPSPPPADLCPPPMDLVRVVGSESGRYHPPLTPERLF